MIGGRKSFSLNSLAKAKYMGEAQSPGPMENPEWRTRYWDDSEVTQLLALWGDKNVQRELDGTRRDNQVFIKLSEDLGRRGIRRSPAQVREKIKILKREYRLCLGRVTLPGATSGKSVPPGKFKYFEQMKEILGANHSPTSQSVPSPNETSSNENMSTCASNYLDYLQRTQDYETKPLDLHVSSDAVNNLLRGISPKENEPAEGRGIIAYGGCPPSPKRYPKRAYTTDEVGNRASESSDSETNGPTSEKRGRYFYETSTEKQQDTYLVQDILDRIFNYFRESDERFFQLEEKRMKHEKELEAMRQDREAKLLDKLCQMTVNLKKCCHCHCPGYTPKHTDQISNVQESTKPKSDPPAGHNLRSQAELSSK